MVRILIGTSEGLRSFDERGDTGTADHKGRSVTAVVRDGSDLWALVDRDEIWHAPDGEWRHVATLTGHTATCIAMTDAIQVGSSEARLFRLNGRTLEPVEAFDALEGRAAWYTPWGVLPTRGRSPSGAKMSM